jgi:hypothetical protein
LEKLVADRANLTQILRLLRSVDFNHGRRGTRGGVISVLDRRGGVPSESENGVLLVLGLDGEVEDVLLVSGRKAREDSDDAEETRLSAVLGGVHGKHHVSQEATKGLDADLMRFVFTNVSSKFRYKMMNQVHFLWFKS